MKISVTQSNIEQGEVQSLTSCPIALAARREWNLAAGCVQVTEDEILWIDGTQWQSRRLPLNAKEFVTCFDDHMEVAPFEFELDIENTSAK